jgi:hypothetical protein
MKIKLLFALTIVSLMPFSSALALDTKEPIKVELGASFGTSFYTPGEPGDTSNIGAVVRTSKDNMYGQFSVNYVDGDNLNSFVKLSPEVGLTFGKKVNYFIGTGYDININTDSRDSAPYLTNGLQIPIGTNGYSALPEVKYTFSDNENLSFNFSILKEL